MPVDIEGSKTKDNVGQDFEANYLPGTTDKDLEDARELMETLLKKYGSRAALEANESDWRKYRRAIHVVASRSKDTMDAANKAREDLIKRKNLLSKFFEENTEILFKLPEWARINLRKYTDCGLLVDQEYLWQALGELGEDGLAEHLLNVANYIYLDTGFMGGVRGDSEALKRGPVRSIYSRPTCRSQKTVHPKCGCNKV
jgi:hypothetical protein